MQNYWVLKQKQYQANILVKENIIEINNGLIRRIIDANKGTLSITNLTTDREYINKYCSDIELVIDGKEIDFYSYFKYKTYSIMDSIIPNVHYEPTKNCTDIAYATIIGKTIDLKYFNEDYSVTVRYETFDNAPIISKQVFITNTKGQAFIVNKFAVDKILITPDNYKFFYAETNYNGGCMNNAGRQLSVQYNDVDTLRVAFDIGPNAQIPAGSVFEGLKSYELTHTASYYEQKLIEVKEMYRIIMPWILESPLIFHVTEDSNRKVKKAIDMVNDTNFDMLIQSFGSNVNVESNNPKYIARHKKLYDYAHSHGILIGAYTLAIVKNYRAIHTPEVNLRADPKTKIIRCLATEWSEKYWESIYNFYQTTGADAIEIDGPYHFMLCDGGETHLHKNVDDSRYLQWKLSTCNSLKKFKEMNVYVNAPEWLFTNGSNKTGIGYEEIAFGRPRQEQLVNARIYNYKGTFSKIPSMAWAFLPLGNYKGGGKVAIFEPLRKNLIDYDWAIAQHILSGVIPCFRGKKLYDDGASLSVVQKWVSFYKKYRKVINGNTIHFLPPVMDEKNPKRTTKIDAILNVWSDGDVRGVLGVFNQTDKSVAQTIKVPMYYTGLTNLKDIPSPPINSGILDVKHNVYGMYPPLYPIEKGSQGAIIQDPFTVITKNIELEREEHTQLDNGKCSGMAIFEQEEKTSEVVSINSNGDAILNINLAPMSYTWYIIKPV